MAGSIANQLRDITRLLREGRPTEADRQLDTMATELERKASEELMKQPAPGPKTPEELTAAVNDEVSRLLGNPPKLSALLTELKGALAPKTE
jgi:hypothetical protein